MFKIQMFKTVLNLGIRILNLFRISNLGFGIYNLGFIYQALNYEKETAKITPQVYQEREGSDSPGGFGFK